MIIQKSKTKLTNPYIICGWPGIGLIGHYVVNYIISQIKPEIFAEIDYKEYIIPHNAVVENGIIYDMPQIQNKIFYHKIKSKPYSEQDFLLFLGDIEPSLYNMQNFANDLLSFFQLFNPKLIITFCGLPSNILHTDEPSFYIAKTNNNLEIKIKNEELLGLKPLTFGIIEGMNGLILSKAKEYEIDGVCIIGEIPFYTIDMINPKVCYKILYFLKENFLFNISFEKIQQDIISLDERIKSTFTDLNEKAQMLLSQIQNTTKNDKKNLYYKTTENSLGLTFEELKKKIKFSLPESAKNKINELFKLASENISYAKQLKEELDKWGVYKEYEDRFLSLFIKNKKKGKK
ncbi:MAG: PAC2 family protein [Endomicrobiia bacterium]